MKNNPVAIFTGLAVAAAVGLGAIIYSRQPTTIAEKPPEPTVAQPATPEKPADATAEKKPESTPSQPEQTAKTETPESQTAPETAEKKPEAAPAQPEEAAKTETPAPETAKAPEPAKEPEAEPKPTFDTVRVEPDGGTLAAGQATPGADVTLKRNGEVVGQAQANAEGDWVVVTEAPLPKGASELSVEQKTADSAQTVMSDQSIAVIVPSTPTEKAIVALVEPGMPTQVLQKAEPATTAEATPPKPAATAETAEQPTAAEKPAAEEATTAGSETPAPAEKAPEAAPETKTALVEPTEPAKTEEPAAQAPAIEQPAAETPVAKPGAPVSLDAVDYNAAGDIVFSGSAAPGSAVRVYVDNAPVGDALADQAGHWTFAGTQKVAPGGHSLRVDQIDAAGKVLSRVELPFVREEASRVAEMNTPETEAAAQPEQQKPADVAEPAPATPEATVTAETVAPKPATSETSEAAATADTQLAPTPETAAPATQAETEIAKPEQGEDVAKAEAPAVAPTEEPAAQTEQPATTTQQPVVEPEEPAVAKQDQPTTEAETTEQAATAETSQIEQKSTDAAGATVANNEPAQSTEPKKGRIIIQPGNNLWKLSRVIYGKGMSYTVIYEANKGVIRDPDLIYPGQIFATPNAVPPETIDPKRKKPLSAEEGGTTVQ